MKLGEFEKFNDCCGIAYVTNDVTNEDWFVVYADVFNKADWDKQLGGAVGKGKTREEALIDALKFFVKREKVYEDSFNEEEEDETEIKNILHKAIDFLSSRMLTNQKEVVLPIRGWKHNPDTSISLTDEHWNASIYFDSEGEAYEGGG